MWWNGWRVSSQNSSSWANKAVSLITHMADGEYRRRDGDGVSNEVDYENEEKRIEAPVEDVDDDVPMADEWVNFTYEVFWQVFECGPVAECRWSIWNVEDVHELMMVEDFGAEMVMRLGLPLGSSDDVPLLGCFELVGFDCRPSYGRTGG